MSAIVKRKASAESKVDDATRVFTKHKQLLKTAYVWLDEDLWTGDDGVFGTARRMRESEPSFGTGILLFNR